MPSSLFSLVQRQYNIVRDRRAFISLSLHTGRKISTGTAVLAVYWMSMGGKDGLLIIVKTTTSPHHVCTRIHHEMQHRTTTAQQEKLELTRQHVSIPKIYSRKPGTRTAYVVQQYEYNMPVLLLLRQLFHSCYQCEQLQQYILSKKKKTPYL